MTTGTPVGDADLSPIEAAVFDLVRALMGERAHAHAIAPFAAEARSA